VLRQYTTILMVALMMLLPQVVWAGIQWGPNGQPSDVFYDAEGEPSYILVIQDQAPVFEDFQQSAKLMQKASFGIAHHIADEVTHNGKTYYLMVDFDSVNWEIKKFLGWISADSVLRNPKPLIENGIALKGFIINRDAYKGANKSYAPNPTVGQFEFFFAFAQKNGYTLLARQPILLVENAETQLLGWVADINLYIWKTRQAIEFDKSTVERRKLGVKIFQNQQEVIDFYLHGKKIVPLVEEDLNVKTPWPPNLMRFPIISSMTHPILGTMYQVDVIGTQNIIQPVWVMVNEHETGIRQVREVLLINRFDLESYLGLLTTFVKKPISKKAIMTTWKRALEENLGEADLDKSVSELVKAHLGLPVKNKMLQMTLTEISKLSGKQLKDFGPSLYKDLLYLRSFVQEELIEAVEDNKSRFGWKPVRKGTKKVWWKFGNTYEYGWIPLDVMP